MSILYAMVVAMTILQQSAFLSLFSSVTVVTSFQPLPGVTRVHQVSPSTITTTTTTTLNVFGTKKTKKMTPEELEKYWQGDWVCKDCGYIYNRVSYSFVLA
jgi:hypothetical protein